MRLRGRAGKEESRKVDGELRAGSLQKRPEAWEGRTWSVRVEHPPYTKEACFSRGVQPEFRGSGYTHYKAPSTPRGSGNQNKDNTPSSGGSESGGSESVWHLPVQAQIPAAEPTLSILLTSLACTLGSPGPANQRRQAGLACNGDRWCPANAEPGSLP